MKKNMTLIIIGGIVVIVVLWFISAQNGLVTKEEAVTAKWSQVENVYQRRLDLIPNLVETVKGYAAHEEGTLTRVTELRSRVGGMNVSSEILDDPAAMQKFQQAQSELGGALQRLLVVSENYPDLKANTNFIALQNQLEGTEITPPSAGSRPRLSRVSAVSTRKRPSLQPPAPIRLPTWNFDAEATAHNDFLTADRFMPDGDGHGARGAAAHTLRHRPGGRAFAG